MLPCGRPPRTQLMPIALATGRLASRGAIVLKGSLYQENLDFGWVIWRRVPGGRALLSIGPAGIIL